MPGDTLRRLVQSGPVPIDSVVIGLQLAKALAVAHTAGVVHRDIKPETSSDAKRRGESARLRSGARGRRRESIHDGHPPGMPAYMSPEQACGQQADFRTDLFAVGLMLYELASGINPFAAATVTATIARIVEEDPASLSQVQPSAVPELERIVTICLQKDPLKRHHSTQELVVDLEELAADLAERRRKYSHSSHAPHSAERFKPRWWWQIISSSRPSYTCPRCIQPGSRQAAATPLGRAVHPHGAVDSLRSHEPAAARMVHLPILPERAARPAVVDPRPDRGGATWRSRRSSSWPPSSSAAAIRRFRCCSSRYRRRPW